VKQARGVSFGPAFGPGGGPYGDIYLSSSAIFKDYIVAHWQLLLPYLPHLPQLRLHSGASTAAATYHHRPKFLRPVLSLSDVKPLPPAGGGPTAALRHRRRSSFPPPPPSSKSTGDHRLPDNPTLRSAAAARRGRSTVAAAASSPAAHIAPMRDK
jgi:hypothetical protein